jgi:hypothetical protein
MVRITPKPRREKMKIRWNSVEYGPGGCYYFYGPHWLKKGVRHIGIERMYYDGPHVSLGFWFFNITWSSPWTKNPFDY